MLLKNASTFALSLIVLCAIGCGEDEFEQPVSFSPDDVSPDETKPWGQVVIDSNGTEEWGTDDFELSAASITGDTLAVTVSYSGGCKAHQLTLVSPGLFLESNPVQLVVALAHNANGDSCEAWLTQDYFFRIAPIKTLYQEAYLQDSGTIVLLLKDAPDELVYEFAQ